MSQIPVKLYRAVATSLRTAAVENQVRSQDVQRIAQKHRIQLRAAHQHHLKRKEEKKMRPGRASLVSACGRDQIKEKMKRKNKTVITAITKIP